jgi:hypothetical protein
MRRASLLLVGLVALLLVSAADAAGADKTFDVDGIGITFKYPASFKPIKRITFQKSAGSQAVARGAVALDKVNLIIVSRYNLRIAITPANLPRFKHEVDTVIGKVAGRTVSGRRVAYGGLPGYEYWIKLAAPANAASRMVVLFDAATEYLINCQSTPPNRQTVEAACRKALQTLERR